MIETEIWLLIFVCVSCFMLGMMFDVVLRTKTPATVLHDILEEHHPNEMVESTEV